MEFLRAKKGIQKTRVLSVLKGDVISKGVESNIRDFDRITNQWGVTFKFVNAEDFLDEIGNLSPEEVETAEKTADALMAGAESCTVSRDDMIRSAKVYVAAKKMLDLFDCNAFTIPCFEICATRRLNEERYTFCLTHSLLKEEGIPSACESDYNSLLSMIVMMNLADNAPHMGNMHPALPTRSRRAWPERRTSSGFTIPSPPGICAEERPRGALRHPQLHGRPVGGHPAL